MAESKQSNGLKFILVTCSVSKGLCFTIGTQTNSGIQVLSSGSEVESLSFSKSAGLSKPIASNAIGVGALSSGFLVALASRAAPRRRKGRRNGLLSVVRTAQGENVAVAERVGELSDKESAGVDILGDEKVEGDGKQGGKPASAEAGWGWKGKVVSPSTTAGSQTEETPQVNSGLLAVPPWFRGSDDCELTYAQQELFGQLVTPGPYDAGGPRSKKVLLSVFDVSGAVQEKDIKRLTEMCSRPVDGFWHVSVRAFGHNYDNARMVDGILPSTLAPFLRYQFQVGTDRTLEEFTEFFEKLRSDKYWALGGYDMKDRNCNHFQAASINFLAGPDRKVGALTEAPEILSPLDFDLGDPDPMLNKIANNAVMRGMLRMRRETKKKKEEEMTTKMAGIGGLLVALGSTMYGALHH